MIGFASQTDDPPEWNHVGIKVVPWLPKELRPAYSRPGEALPVIRRDRVGGANCFPPSTSTPETIDFVRWQRDGWVALTAWEACPPELHAYPSWEWADVEPDRARVVWTENCVLRAAALSATGLGDPKTLLDTRSMVFEPLVAPY